MKSDARKSCQITGNSALILVDIQNDFLPGGALAVRDGDAVVPVANRLRHQFPHVVATRDWHPANHGSFVANHVGHSPGDIIQLDGLDQVLWPVHCVQHSTGAELAGELCATDAWHVVFKGQHENVDSYSGFFDNGRRHQTGLGDYLKAAEVNRVFVMGLATDYCVKFTALDAVQLGFQTFVVEDGCRGVELRRGDVTRALEEMRAAGIGVVQSTQLVPAFESDPDSRQTGDGFDTGAVPIVLAQTPHLELVRRAGWDYVRRTTARAIVAIVAVTSDDEILFVEQYRIPVGNRVVELPAGLAGDIPGAEGESLECAARRELLEETGFRAGSMNPVFSGPSSAGLSDETIHFFLARDLEKVHEGGGDDSEQIVVHRIRLDDVDSWLSARQDAGCLVDARLPTGIFIWQQQLRKKT